MIELKAGRWRAALRPELGGSVMALECEGVSILRTADQAVEHPLQTACFPMVPYCNRIARGCFEFGGHAVKIAPNLAGQRHPLHGTGWLRPWHVVRSDASSALLEDDHAGDGDWPWPYRAHQHFALDTSGITVSLMVENRAAEPAPVGLGMHPYFRRSADSVVSFNARQMLGIDAELLPDGRNHDADTLAPWGKGALLPSLLVDHCFLAWSGVATISDSLGSIVLKSFGAPHCHVYAPPSGTELCLEPVSHTPDALNRAPHEMTILAPGAAAGIAMRIEVR